MGMIGRVLGLGCTIVALSRGVSACAEGPPIITVDYCDLVSHPETYDGVLVRTTTLLWSSPEKTVLRDAACGGTELQVWCEWEGYEAGTSKAIRRRVRKLLRKEGKVAVTIVGRFHGPHKYEPPKEMNEALADLMRRANSRYGHMNCCPFMLEVFSIESGESVNVKGAAPPSS